MATSIADALRTALQDATLPYLENLVRNYDTRQARALTYRTVIKPLQAALNGAVAEFDRLYTSLTLAGAKPDLVPSWTTEDLRATTEATLRRTLAKVTKAYAELLELAADWGASLDLATSCGCGALATEALRFSDGRIGLYCYACS